MYRIMYAYEIESKKKTLEISMWRDRDTGRMSLDLYWRGWLTTKGECTMAKAKSTSTSIKAKLGMQGVADGNVVTALTASYNGVLNNSAYPTPPFDLATYKAGIDKFSALVVDAEDGGKKAVSAKNKQREVVIKMIRFSDTTSRARATEIWRPSTPAVSRRLQSR